MDTRQYKNAPGETCWPALFCLGLVFMAILIEWWKA